MPDGERRFLFWKLHLRDVNARQNEHDDVHRCYHDDNDEKGNCAEWTKKRAARTNRDLM